MKPRQVAPNSLILFTNSQGETARGTILKLERSSVVFEVYNPYSIVQLSEVLQELTIRRGERVIYKGRAVVTNLVNTGLMLIVSASLVDSWSHVPSSYEDVGEFRRDAFEFVDQWGETTKLRGGYRVVVGKLCSFLKELNQWLEQIEASGSDFLIESFATYDSLFDYAAPILDKLGDLIREFQVQAQKIEPPYVGFHKAFLHRELHPLTMRAPFLHRTYHKPLGYAGDYEMMNMIHRKESEGANTYAKIVNAAHVNLPIAVCVRNRAEMLEQYLKRGVQRKCRDNGVFRVASIGCGPAIEVQRFVKSSELAENSSFDLIDFNKQTLDYAHRKVTESIASSGHRVELSTIHQSVHFLLKKAASQAPDEWRNRYDFVYCAGLFDYLSDKVCARLMRLFYSWLKPNGVMLVTNMHDRQGDRYVLEHLADWYLIYRNEQQMEKMIPDLGEQRIFTDDTGINLCLEVRKTDDEAVLR